MHFVNKVTVRPRLRALPMNLRALADAKPTTADVRRRLENIAKKLQYPAEQLHSLLCY